jgi:hypothetical protein
MGVKHVIAFDFDKYVKYSTLIGKIYDVIYKFCTILYSKLMKVEGTLEKCFERSYA